jgi:ankyrin repeat protein
MDEFRLQRSLSRWVRAERPTVKKGMAQVLARLVASPNGGVWKQCAAIDWTRGERRWIKWFDALLRKHPIPEATQLLWFETPSELNPAMTSVSAFAKLGPPDERFGLDAKRTWPCNAEGWTLPAGLHDLPELEEAIQRSGFRGGDDAATGRLSPAVFAISSAYTALLVLNGLSKTGLLSRLRAGSVAVLFGWAEGDEQEVGHLGLGGWGPIKRVRRTGPPDPKVFDPDSYKFDVKQFVAAGKDPDQRDKAGRTVVMRLLFRDYSNIDGLLKAGADPRAVDKNGRGLLHHLGKEELRTLRRILEAGANPKQVDKDGWSVMDTVMNSGLCTLQHLQVLHEAGARPRRSLMEGGTPLHEVAADSCGEPSDAKSFETFIRFWLERGYKVNARRRDGLTPLWVSLREHARHLEADLRAGIRDPKNRESNYGGHDRVAMILLKHGADPDARYAGPKVKLIPEGATPLMTRCYDDDKLVRALLKQGADPHALCAKGKTALEYAEAVASDSNRPDRKGAAAAAAALRRALAKARRA